jgi:hypothetical protein
MEQNNSEEEQKPMSDTLPDDLEPYEKPAFVYERVFETMALACGKIGSQQRQCQFSRKNS